MQLTTVLTVILPIEAVIQAGAQVKPGIPQRYGLQHPRGAIAHLQLELTPQQPTVARIEAQHRLDHGHRFAPAIGVWLYGHSQWIGFAVIEALCLAVIVLGWRSLSVDDGLTGAR